ncbi:NAD(P)/FAD-dependent oxidoreductase [Dictyobacter kobayashii]|uniref:Amine oxidase n=1 Tax=Dictyobacter kobayashii TaxID=2014872 RepID=A0A402AMB6_9CHLR|nr:NAD(P)/FAD-dependent oxidoreductase [Dictyobacter kobayashii]GCE20348.1 amine oxidase [Dictyobacter kobayashii]
MIIIVGAGLAGLTCAKLLAEAGQEVLVLEAADQVGGRVRTDYHEDGYRLDRGFQVLFTSYEAAAHHLNYNTLKQRKFNPGAILLKNGKQHEITDPLREPTHTFSSLINPLISTADKLRIVKLRLQLQRISNADIFAGTQQKDGQDESTEAYLRRQGFSDKIIDNFFRPFYGGIFLDRSLQTSARMFQFTFKMLATGDIILPAEGIQRIPEQLAASLPRGSVRCNARVAEVLISNGQARGVRLINGEEIKAETIVVATSSPIAEKFVHQTLPDKPVSAVCLYFAGDERLYNQRKILLNADPHAYVNNAVLVSNIAPTYAPPRKHLLSVTVLGNPKEDDEGIAERSKAEIAGWFPNHDLKHWQLLAVYRIPFAQFLQAPGVYDTLPGNRTDVNGLYLAGEYTQSSSIQGAMHSGECAARELLKIKQLVPSQS